MRKRILLFALVAVLLASSFAISALANTEPDPWDGTSVDTEWYGDGTADSFEIKTAAELAGLAQLVNAGNSFSGKTITLAADIDLNNCEWTPIGKSSSRFCGAFDGANYTVSNLTITSGARYVGLFGSAGSPATIQNITITNASVSGDSWVSVLVGEAYGAPDGAPVTIDNCHVSGNITVTATGAYVGGIVGKAFVTAVSNCSVNSTSQDTSSIICTYSYTGGIIGFTDETGLTVAENCSVSNITIQAMDTVGGIMGIAHMSNRIVGNTATNVAVIATGTDGTSGMIAGCVQGSTAKPIIFANNAVASSTRNGEASDLQTSGVNSSGTENDTYFVGENVVLDSKNKIVSGNFSVFNAEIASVVLNANSEYDSETGTVKHYVATIDTTRYESVQAAVDAAVENDTITLLEDIEMTAMIAIPEGKTLTLDLAGKAITVTKSGDRSLYAFDNKGTLTLTDSVGTGSITARGNYNYGTLVMDGGSIIACDTNGGYGIWNYGTFIMNGGLLKATHVGSYGDQYGPTCLGNMTGASALITGGTIESASMRAYAISSDGTLEITPAEGKTVTVTGQRAVAIDAGTAVINGGTFTALETPEGLYAPETYYALYINNGATSVTVNGGTFNAPDSSVQIGTKDSINMTGTVTINGGTFNAPLNGQDTGTNHIPADALTITGGTFSSDPSEFLAEGKMTSKVTTGTNVEYAVKTFVNDENDTTIQDTIQDQIVSGTPNEKVEIELPKTDSSDLTNVMNQIQNATDTLETKPDITLTIPMKEGTVVLDNDVIETIQTNSNTSTVQLSIVPVADAINTYTITLTKDNQPISQLGGNATVTLPVPDDIKAPMVQYYDEAAQKWVDVASTVVDGEIVFVTDHFSNWRIVEGPRFSKVNMTLSGILGINFKVNKGDAESMEGYSVRVTIGSSVQNITTYSMDGELYAFTAKLMASEMFETLTVELLYNGNAIQTETFTVEQYVTDLKTQYPDNTNLTTLLDAMVNYGKQATYYVGVKTDTTLTAPSITEVQKVTGDDLASYTHVLTTDADSLNAVASLNLNEACDLKFKFDKSGFEGCTLYVNDVAIATEQLTEESGMLVYSIDRIVAKAWDTTYKVEVKNGETTLFLVEYSVLSYAQIHLSSTSSEIETGLNDLLRAMYLYHLADKNYQTT